MNEINLVLDSNEYVFHFNNNTSILKLLKLKAKIYLNNLIFKEVIRNIRRETIKYFINLLKNPRFVVIEEKIPQILIGKYKRQGLKKGDVIIAAFCDYVNADYLVSENRHFLKSARFDKFKVLDLNTFLKMI